MPTANNPEFRAMLREMAVYCARKEQDGWESADMRYWCGMIMEALLHLASNPAGPSAASMKQLAEYTSRLEQARDAARL
jgi:hypothetical protein